MASPIPDCAVLHPGYGATKYIHMAVTKSLWLEKRAFKEESPQSGVIAYKVLAFEQVFDFSHDAGRIDALVRELLPQAAAAFFMRRDMGKFRRETAFQEP